MEKSKLRLKSIQFFAEGEDDGEKEKSYSQKDIDDLKSEIERIKKANDKLSSENADYKRKAKEKLSEEEKNLQNQKEKEEELASVKRDLLSMKLSKEFMLCGFNEQQTDEIIKSFNQEDYLEFAKTLSKKINELVDNVKKEAKDEFNRSSKIPQTGKEKSGLDPIIEKYINKKKSLNDAREKVLNK